MEKLQYEMEDSGTSPDFGKGNRPKKMEQHVQQNIPQDGEMRVYKKLLISLHQMQSPYLHQKERLYIIIQKQE